MNLREINSCAYLADVLYGVHIKPATLHNSSIELEYLMQVYWRMRLSCTIQMTNYLTSSQFWMHRSPH